MDRSIRAVSVRLKWVSSFLKHRTRSPRRRKKKNPREHLQLVPRPTTSPVFTTISSPRAALARRLRGNATAPSACLLVLVSVFLAGEASSGVVESTGMAAWHARQGDGGPIIRTRLAMHPESEREPETSWQHLRVLLELCTPLRMDSRLIHAFFSSCECWRHVA